MYVPMLKFVKKARNLLAAMFNFLNAQARDLKLKEKNGVFSARSATGFTIHNTFFQKYT